MFKWRKIGKIIDTKMYEDIWWLNEYTQCPSAIVFNDFIRVYFCSRGHPDSNNISNSYIGFMDIDIDEPTRIIRLSEKPLLDLGDIGSFDEYGTYPVSAIRQGNEIRLYYGGITRCATVPFNAAIGAAVSFDEGFTFKKMGPGPVLSYSIDEPFVIGSPKIRHFNGKWYLWYASGKDWKESGSELQPVYKIRCAVSDDGYNWNKYGYDLLSSVLEENECQASPDVYFENGIYHMFFSYRYNFGFKTRGRGYRIGYAYSYDLKTWIREDYKAGLDVSETGWDSESVSYMNVFKVKDTIYSLYQGNLIGKDGIGIATLESSSFC